MIHSPAFKLTTERLILRLATQDDLLAILQFYQDNQAHLAPFEPARPKQFWTEPYWQEQVHLSWEGFQSGQFLRLFLFENQRPRSIVGTANFNNIVRGAFQACHLGYSLANSAQGKGYMTEALRSAIPYVFDELNLHRIMANYMPHNHRSARVLERLGFSIEGCAKNYLLINGQWEDHILTSLTNDRWRSG
ncbi:MAG: ribosomal protein S5-alanine N-acetyltransferase [Leptolyngbyaceae cyanobacterium SL_7_1]|nr:ribosomal protein S5-alanine N-acetyltransferase [Leptolyngbyaceae cyanobacterium SL_7_1]